MVNDERPLPTCGSGIHVLCSVELGLKGLPLAKGLSVLLWSEVAVGEALSG